MTHRYNLAKKGKHICPNCGRKRFVLYIDTNTGAPLHYTVGKCDRESNCGYHYPPKQYFTDNPTSRNYSFDRKQPYTPRTMQPQVKPKTSYINVDVFKQSLQSYKSNHLYNWLRGVVGTENTNNIIGHYFVGTSKHWDGATVFWQIDVSGKVRTGKIMQYNPSTGKREKEPYNKIGWVHSVLKLQDFNLKQCLFGEHLLRDNAKKVAIVESEKTALIASCYFPNFVWLACGGLSNLNAERCEVLKNRNVVLFPDLKCVEKWKEKAYELAKFCKVSISDYLEKVATDEERVDGLDLADYLLRLPAPDTLPTGANNVVCKPKNSNAANNISEVKSKPKQLNTGDWQICLDVDGKVYFQRKDEDTMTVWASVEDYNERKGYPKFISRNETPTFLENSQINFDADNLLLTF